MSCIMTDCCMIIGDYPPWRVKASDDRTCSANRFSEYAQGQDPQTSMRTNFGSARWQQDLQGSTSHRTTVALRRRPLMATVAFVIVFNSLVWCAVALVVTTAF